MNTTTQRFPRTSRGSGTQYAASIERQRRSDIGGQIIVFVMCAVLMALTYWIYWGSV